MQQQPAHEPRARASRPCLPAGAPGFKTHSSRRQKPRPGLYRVSFHSTGWYIAGWLSKDVEYHSEIRYIVDCLIGPTNSQVNEKKAVMVLVVVPLLLIHW